MVSLNHDPFAAMWALSQIPLAFHDSAWFSGVSQLDYWNPPKNAVVEAPTIINQQNLAKYHISLT